MSSRHQSSKKKSAKKRVRSDYSSDNSVPSSSSIEIIQNPTPKRRHKKRTSIFYQSSSDSSSDTTASPVVRELRSGTKIVIPIRRSSIDEPIISSVSTSRNVSSTKTPYTPPYTPLIKRPSMMMIGSSCRSSGTFTNDLSSRSKTNTLQVRGSSNHTRSEPCKPNLGALQLKKMEIEIQKQFQLKRDSMMNVLKSRTMSNMMLELGDYTRDASKSCEEAFQWNVLDWKATFQKKEDGHEGKAWVYELRAHQHQLEIKNLMNTKHNKKNKTERRKIGTSLTVWPVSLQMDGISLLIMKSGGTRVRLSQSSSQLQKTSHQGPLGSNESDLINWDTFDGVSEIRAVFVHRDAVEEFLDRKEGAPGVVDLTKHSPRIQIFVIGYSSKLAHMKGFSCPLDLPVELILKAGAIIFPTFESLFKRKRSSDDEGNDEPYYVKLSKACRFHPFIRVCLRPSIRTRVAKNLARPTQPSLTTSTVKNRRISDQRKNKGVVLTIEDIFGFLNDLKLDSSHRNEGESLGQWISKPRTQIGLLQRPTTTTSLDNGLTDLQEEMDDLEDVVAELEDEGDEIEKNGRIMNSTRKELYKDFRRFIVVVSSQEVVRSRNVEGCLLNGIEYMSIDQLCKILPHEAF